MNARQRLASSALSVAIAACAPRAPEAASRGPAPSAVADAGRPAERVRFAAIVRLSPAGASGADAGSAAVLLEREDGSAWVASDAADALWKAFEGRRVDVVGERDGASNASGAPHVHVLELRLVHPDAEARFVAMKAETTIAGHFAAETWPEGTKLAGETTLRFVADDGRTFLVAFAPSDAPRGRKVTVRARVIEPSPYAAHPGGDALWVDAIVER